MEISKELAIFRVLVLAVIMLSVGFSTSLSVRSVSAYIVNLPVVLNNLTATSGSDTQVIGFAVSTTYYSCWVVYEATWSGAAGSAHSSIARWQQRIVQWQITTVFCGQVPVP